ncbi:MAG: hypothetical protein HRT89_20890, partial [Lentisphaeria bacterium]|nr:hypothetical protein [Lentisphaeria bacterium]NQZ70517.1 hypothetical protein [Lentisphaeria bacterium]
MDHAKDKDLPNWMAMKTPNTIMHMKWLGQITQQKYLIPAKGNTAVIINKPGKESFLRSKAPGIAGSIIYKGKWVTSVYPKFAMRYKLAKDAKSAFNLLLMVYKSYIHINLHPLDNKYAAFIKQYKSEDGWVNCFIDMDALLKDEQTRINIKKNKKGFIIKQIFFNRAKTVKNEAIDIQTMSMYRDLRTTDKLKLDGFDASGIACYDWEIIRDKKAVSSGSSTSLKVDFSKIPFANKKGHWLNIYLRDNSNTRSVPLRIAL